MLIGVFKKIPAVAFVLALLLVAPASWGKVTVKVGPTPIPGGDALDKDDLTIKNDKFAVSIAVGTVPPWGVPKGGILDAAPILKGKSDMDRMSLMDFIPNNWSDWPTTYQKVNILEESDSRAIVEIERDWGMGQLISTYTVNDGDDRIHFKTIMKNKGQVDSNNIYSGYVIWPKGGSLKEPASKAVVLLEGLTELADRFTNHTIASDETWAMALYSPYFSHLNYSGKDMYLKHSLPAGAEKFFEAWLQILPSGDISRVVTTTASFKGQVEAVEGMVISSPAVIAEREGVVYSWTIGKNGFFEFILPVEEYDVFAAALNRSPSVKQKITIKEDESLKINFSGLDVPGVARIKVKDQNGQALPARISILKGVLQPIPFFGAKTFFTELKPNGELVTPLAPGHYEFVVTYGAHVLAKAASVKTTVKPKEVEQAEVIMRVEEKPTTKGWYNADLHHHSNLLDGVTPPVCWELISEPEVAWFFS